MPRHGRRFRSAALTQTAIALIGLLAAPIQHSAAQDAQDSIRPAGPAATIADARNTLRNPQATQEDRRAAAHLLLRSDNPAIRAMLHRAVLEDHPQGTRRPVAEAIALDNDPPRFIEPALTAATIDAAPEHLTWLLPALRNFRSHAAVASVVDLLRRNPPLPEGAARFVCLTLAEQTGASDPASDPDAWIDWWADHHNDTPEQWYRMIANSQATRARLTALDRDQLTTDVEHLYQEIHARTPVGERSPLIAGLIRSERLIFVSIGFDLARRALLNARPLGPIVVEAAADRLDDPKIEIRQGAASLLDRMDPPDIGPRAARALRTETDAEVAAPLLRILSRQPESGVNQATARWAQRPGPAHAPALAAAAALLNSGYLKNPELIAQIEQAARNEVDAGNPTVAGVRFLAANGRADLCVALLGSTTREIALAAADAVAASPEHVERLIEAARDHPDLFEHAGDAIILHRPTTSGMRTLLSLQEPSEDERRRVAARLASTLPPEDLLAAVSEIKDPSLRLACLAHVASLEFVTRPDQAQARRDLLRLLLETRLAQQDPEGVLQALTTVQEAFDTTPYVDLRVAALLRTGRLEEAESIPGAADVPVVVWLDALESTGASPFADALAQTIRARFEDSLTEDERRRLKALESAITPPPTDAAAVPEEASQGRTETGGAPALSNNTSR